MQSHEDTNRTCIIVVQVASADQQITMGIIVDEVSEVLDVNPDQMEPSPSLGKGVETDFIFGMGKIGDKVVMLLDVDKALSATDEALLTQINQEQ